MSELKEESKYVFNLNTSKLGMNVGTFYTILVTFAAGIVGAMTLLFSIKNDISNLRYEMKTDVSALRVDCSALSTRVDLLQEKVWTVDMESSMFAYHIGNHTNLTKAERYQIPYQIKQQYR